MVELFDTYGILYIGALNFLFDLDDLPVIENRSWYVDKDGYLTSSYYYRGSLRIVRFHRIVAHPKPGQRVDHRNKNRADNRKQNLRCCSFSENNRNRGLYSTNTSGMDSLPNNVIIIGTTNRYDRLDPALARRFPIGYQVKPFTQQEVMSLTDKFFRYAGYEMENDKLQSWCNENFEALDLAENGVPVYEVVTKCTDYVVGQIVLEEEASK